MNDSKILAQTLIKLSQSKNNEKSVNNFFEYLKRKSFLGLLPQIKEHVKRQSKNILDKKTLTITSKHKLSEQEIKEIISLVEAGADVNLKCRIERNIIGGFSATYNGNIYNGSLEDKIAQLHDQLKYS